MYHDIDAFGRESAPGIAVEHFDESAVKSALIMWLTSKQGDYIRNPGEGGPLEHLVFKPMSGGYAESVIFRIKNELTNFFTPAIKLNSIELIPNREKRYWEVNISYYGVFVDELVQLIFYTKGLNTERSSYTYEDIDLIELNLRNFCETKKPSMNREKLLYSSVEDTWVWGKYKLINLTPLDAYFSEILEIANL